MFVACLIQIQSFIRDRTYLNGVLLFDKQLQTIQILGPEHTVSFEPGVDRFQRFGIELIDAMASAAGFYNQVCLSQLTQVLGNSGT